MEVIFDKFSKTPKIDGRLKQVFGKHYEKNNRFNLVIDGKVVGGVDIAFCMEPAIRVLCCLEIYQPYRRKGYGKILIEKVIEFCKTIDQIRVLELNVEGNNVAAIALYKKMGFDFMRGEEEHYKEVLEGKYGWKNEPMERRLRKEMCMMKFIR